MTNTLGYYLKRYYEQGISKLTPCLKAGALSLALRTILCAHPRCMARLHGPLDRSLARIARVKLWTLNILRTGRLPGATCYIQLCVQ